MMGYKKAVNDQGRQKVAYKIQVSLQPSEKLLFFSQLHWSFSLWEFALTSYGKTQIWQLLTVPVAGNGTPAP